MDEKQLNQLDCTFLQTMDAFTQCQSLYGSVDDQLKRKITSASRRVSEHSEQNTPFRVTFCGVFSAGKSSLINALLQSEYKLPVGINPITKIVTRIQYGSNLSCSYVLNGQEVTLPQEQTAAVITGDTVLPKGCSEVSLRLPSDILRQNVEFLDTPGFDDEMGGELEYMSRRAIANADMVVLCCSSLQLGKIIERELIAELEREAGNFCMVLTRTDCLNSMDELEDVKRKAQWLMHGRGNLAMLPDATGKCFHISCSSRFFTLDGFDTYLMGILENRGYKHKIRSSTDTLNMVSIVADLSYLCDKIAHEINLSSIRGEMPQQDLCEAFVDGMNKMMETASGYCPQCGRKMINEQNICPVCGRVHEIRVRMMNQGTREQIAQISRVVTKDNADYSICWSLEARKMARVIDKCKELAALSNLPGVTGMLRADLEALIADCRNAEFQIAIVGVMKAGKSMLMNALMGEEIASVDINPETASLTKFHSADNYYVKIYFHNEIEWEKLNTSAKESTSSSLARLLAMPEVKTLSQKWLSHEPVTKTCSTIKELRDTVAHWTSARSYDHLFAAEVEVGIDRNVFDMPNEVIFVDTPGLHDPVQYRSDITKDYIKKANAVLIAVPARALTAEGLETITTVLDYIGSKKEKAYIIATQKDVNSAKECEQVINGWITHLVDAKRYQNEDEAKKHILVTSGKMYLLTEKFTQLDENELADAISDDDFDMFEAYVKSVMRSNREKKESIVRRLSRHSYDVELLRDKPEDAQTVMADSGIPALRECISQNLLSKYKDMKLSDIREKFILCRSEMVQIASDVRKANVELLSSVHGGTDSLRKKLDESSKSYEIAKVKNREIREAAALVREFNMQLIESL